MLEAIGTNAHRGYIFLSGLVLLAFADVYGRDGITPTPRSRRPDRPASRRGGTPRPRRAVAAVAVASQPVAVVQHERRGAKAPGRRGGTHGAELRQRHGVGGITARRWPVSRRSSSHGLAALDAPVARFGATDTAHHWLMAALMTRVEDTTALHRCGAAGPGAAARRRAADPAGDRRGPRLPRAARRAERRVPRDGPDDGGRGGLHGDHDRGAGDSEPSRTAAPPRSAESSLTRFASRRRRS